MTMKTRLLSILAIMAMMVSCVKETPSIPDEVTTDIVESEYLVTGEIIVRFSEGFIGEIEEDLASGNIVTKSSELNLLGEQMGITSIRRVFPDAGEFEARTRAEGLHRWYRISYDSSFATTKAADGFLAIPGVETVEPVRKIKNTAIFDDPRLADQWHYYNDGSKDGHKAGADINVYPVWENYTTGREDVIVAIVDGGIDYNHEDLKDNYIAGKSFVSEQAKVVPHDHGTHVAGTVAAVNNNGIGVSGIAGGDYRKGMKGVGLLSCQIFAPNPADPDKDFGGNGAEAIKWGADNGAVISQNSWGYVYETDEEQAAAKIPGYLADAIDYFIKYAGTDAEGKQSGPMKGGVVIFAAGNDARAHDPICKYDPVISVGSIGPGLTRASYSNYGEWVDLAAPGGDAPTTVLSTIPGNKYGYMQGTSMACPHVSGIAALVVSHFGGPGFTAETLRSKLINGANKTALSKNAKIGMLADALGAMTYGGTQPPEPVNTFNASARSNNIDLSWKVTSDSDDRKAYGYILLAAKDRDMFDGLKLSSIPAGMHSEIIMTGDAKVGEEIAGTMKGLEFETAYHVAIAAFDYNRNWSDLSQVASVSTDINKAPAIETSYEGGFKVKSHETLSITYTVSEPDGHDFKVDFSAGSEAASITSVTPGTYQLTIVGNADEPGRYQAVMTATDQYGLATKETIDYEILENRAPVIVKDIEDMIFTDIGGQLKLDMGEYLQDPDGEILKYDISISDNRILHINPKENILYATIMSFGKVDVTITASDSRNEKCVLTFRAVVKDPSKPVEIYPNPVVDFMNISTLDEQQTRITIISAVGQTLYDETFPVSAVEPARVDMTSYAPGMYSVRVAFNGNEYQKMVVKL